MRDTAGSAATPAARWRKFRRRSFILNPPSSFTSLDHLVCEGEQLIGNLEAERLGSLEVKHELELGRSHYRQVARFVALQNSAHIIPSLTQSINQVGPIADKPAVFSCLPCCIT